MLVGRAVQRTLSAGARQHDVAHQPAGRFAIFGWHESNGLRDGPFRFFFFSREEERLHIHVQSADGEAKFWLEPEIELARNYQLSEQDLSRVLQLVVDHEQEIRDACQRHFGR